MRHNLLNFATYVIIVFAFLNPFARAQDRPSDPIPNTQPTEIIAFTGEPIMPRPIDAASIPTHPVMRGDENSNIHLGRNTSARGYRSTTITRRFTSAMMAHSMSA